MERLEIKARGRADLQESQRHLQSNQESSRVVAFSRSS